MCPTFRILLCRMQTRTDRRRFFRHSNWFLSAQPLYLSIPIYRFYLLILCKSRKACAAFIEFRFGDDVINVTFHKTFHLFYSPPPSFQLHFMSVSLHSITDRHIFCVISSHREQRNAIATEIEERFHYSSICIYLSTVALNCSHVRERGHLSRII